MKKSIKTVSLFSGCGGADFGLLGGFKFLNKIYKKLPFEVIWANDIDATAAQTYAKNIGSHIVQGDITTISAKEIPSHDLLVAGFPCQPFSIVGSRGGLNDTRGLLYKEVLKVLKHHKPKYFIAENVKGLISANKGEAIRLILNDLQKEGYHVYQNVINASKYGVPQKRERIFLIGIRYDLKHAYQFPKPTDKLVPLSEVLEDGPIQEKYFFSERAVRGLKKANKAFNKGRVQSLSQPCNTISTHLAKVSLNGTDPVLFEDNRYRRFTPKEAARIQSFPEKFVFSGSDSKQFIQIGNAVPPVVMWHIASSLVNSINWKS